MDNKYFRDEYKDKRTDEVFWGNYYQDFLDAKREVVYVFEDITVEKPNWKDFKHVLKCTLEDEDITYDEYINGSDRTTMYRLMQKVFWFFENDDKDDVYMVFKDNEYAGFFCLMPPKGLQKLTATEMVLRTKFKKSILFVAVADSIINKLYPHDDLSLQGIGENHWKRYTNSFDLEAVQLQVFKKENRKYFHNILQKRINRRMKK